MALTIEQRPEKTLESGLVSKWNASATPLQYKFSSNLFPVNTSDTPLTVDSFSYSSSFRGTGLVLNPSTPNTNIEVGDYITVSNTDIDGTYKVIDIPNNQNSIVIDLFTTLSGQFINGTAIKYYKGYKALVKVFAGSPEYHPYNTDGSKPQTEIGTIEVNFDQNNEGVCNVRNFIKPDMSADFDYDNENSHKAWTSFSIEYAEIWDNKTDGIIFNEDILANCFPFVGFSNSDFNGGLTDWSQTTDPSSANWGSGTAGQVSAIANGQRFTQELYQDIELQAGQKYGLKVDYNLVSGTISDSIQILLFGFTSFGSSFLIQNKVISSIGLGSINLDFYPNNITTSVRVQFSAINTNPNSFTIELTKFELTSDVGNQCKYSSFSIFGSKQFQNSLGGNFGDYLANSDQPGKLLTNFESLKHPFYINSLIPTSTFAQSEGGDSVFLETFIFDSKGVEKEYVRQQIESKSDGVYTVNPEIETESCDWDNGTTQIISVPNNILLDGDGGTYDNEDPNTWNITPLIYSTSNPNYVCFDIIAANQSARVRTSAPSMQSGETLLIARFDTVINVIEGETYTIDSDISAAGGSFEPNQRGNAEAFFYVEGYDISDLTISTFECPNNGSQFPEQGKTSTTFTVRENTSTINIVFCQRLKTNIPTGTGGTWVLDNTTVKGPILYLSEKKPIKAGVCCGKTNQLIRWKNNLGGWDKWNFTRFRTFKENTKNKIEIQRDITQDWDNYFINGDTEFDYISQEVRQIMTLRSELLTQDEQKNLNQIRSSIRVQAFINDRWVTVTVKGGNYTLYDENEKIREVSFDIELPRTLTQEQ